MFIATGKRACFVAALSLLAASSTFAQERQLASSSVVRCAVSGGLNEIDFWPQLADRFQRTTGHRLEIAATGPKQVISAAFLSGEADVIAMHTSDTIVNLVADGHGENLQPWAKRTILSSLVQPATRPRSKAKKTLLPP
ncbi:MAG: hypothetical protein QM778_00475 [Myxococcales bacterium]